MTSNLPLKVNLDFTNMYQLKEDQPRKGHIYVPAHLLLRSAGEDAAASAIHDHLPSPPQAGAPRPSRAALAQGAGMEMYGKVSFAVPPFLTHSSVGEVETLLRCFLDASHSYRSCVFLPLPSGLRKCLGIELISTLPFSQDTRLRGVG